MNEEIKAQINAYLDRHWAEILAELRALVEIPSVGRPGEDGFPYGRACAQVLDYALALSHRKGLASLNHGNWYGTATWGQGSRHVGIFTHLDVVEAGDGWLFPPYHCTEKDGWLIGRGVGDDKLAAVVGIYAVSAVRELKLVHSSRYTVFFGCSEESGMSDLDRYLAEQTQPDLCLVPDIRFPVCVGEKGSLRFSLSRPFVSADLLQLSGGSAPNVVPARAEAVCSGRLVETLTKLAETSAHLDVGRQDSCAVLTAAGFPSSASMPQRGRNAVGLLTSSLAGCESFSAEDRELMARCAALSSAWDGKVPGVVQSDAVSGPLTCVCVRLEGGGGELRLDFDLRYPITCDGEAIIQTLEAFSQAEGWSFAVTSISPPLNVPRDDPTALLLCRCWEEVSGQRGEPFTIGGGTYARKLRRALGFGPDDGGMCPFLPEGHGGIHTPDEARSLQTIRNAVLAYIHALHALDCAPSL